MKKVFPKYTEYEEQTVGTVGNDKIWKDGMGRTTTAADTTEDSDLMADILTTDEVNEIPFVIAVNSEVASGFTAGTGLKFRSDAWHKLFKEKF